MGRIVSERLNIIKTSQLQQQKQHEKKRLIQDNDYD